VKSLEYPVSTLPFTPEVVLGFADRRPYLVVEGLNPVNETCSLFVIEPDLLRPCL
jgi:hypothetical protein